MEEKMKLRLLTIVFVLLPLAVLADSVDNEILVLFKSNAINLPQSKYAVPLDDITGAAKILDCLYDICTIEVRRAMPSFNPTDTIRVTEDGQTAYLPNFSNLFIVQISPKTNRDQAIASLVDLELVVYAEKNQRGYLEYEPEDPKRMYQWYLGEEYIGAYRAFDFSRGSSSTRIGIIDGGVDRNHEDLHDKVIGDYGYSGIHGTHVAGIAAANTDNDTGIVGLDWHAKIWAERIVDWNIPELAEAVIHAANANCKILNNSWGINDFSLTLYSAFTYAYQTGALTVSSMSNSNSPHDYPKRFGPWMTNVGNTNQSNDWETSSVTGYWIDIGAPGVDIYSTIPGGYAPLTGTSMAAPVVSGIAGLLIGANPNLKNYDLEWIMKLFATDIDEPGFDEKTGYGRVNADTALMHVFLPFEISRGPVTTFSLYLDTWRIFLDQPFPGLPAGSYLCDVLKVEQNLNFSPAYAETPYGWISLSGFSGANPNDARYWMKQDFSTSQGQLMTFFYFIKRNAGGETINRWAPVDPNLLSEGLRYTVLGRKPIIAPSNLDATALPNSNGINLTWHDNSHNEQIFKIERSISGSSFSPYDSVDQNLTQYIDNNTVQGQEYWYRIQACAQNFHSNYSNVDSVVSGLAAPSNLTVVEQSTPNSVKIGWSDNALLEAGFQIARALDDVWDEDYDSTPENTEEYMDTVSFLQKYKYKVRAFDGQGNFSDWSNTIAFSAGKLAQSDYPKMSAFNSNCKIVRGTDGKIHIIYYDGDHVFYSYSADGGNEFEPWETVCHADTIPALALDASNTPFLAYGINHDEGSEYHLKYYAGKRTASGWQFTYHPVFRSNQTTSTTMPCPPSIALGSDSAYIAFRDNVTNMVTVSAFTLGLGCYPNGVQISAPGKYPVLGFDNPNAREPRLVVLLRDEQTYGVTLLYRLIGSATWNTTDVTAINGGESCAYGSPSLYTGNNELRVTFEGWLQNEQTQGEFLLSRGLTWSPIAGDYVLNPMEIVTDNFDYDPQCTEGYSFMASKTFVVWKYNDDIWYSRQSGLYSWETPVNISNTASNLSSYPQAILIPTLPYDELFTLWTEKVGDDCYLVRKILTIDTQANPKDADVAESRNSHLHFALKPIHPNPTRGTIRISFVSPDHRPVSVKLYDVTGRMIERLFDGRAKIGLNEISCRGKHLSSGIYFLRLEGRDKRFTEKILFQR